MDEEERQLKQIKRIINRMEGQAGADEVLMEIQQVIPTKIKYINPEPKNSKEQLNYMKEWRKERKKRLALVAKGDKKDNLNQLKINKALERDNVRCFKCGKTVLIDTSLNKYVIESRRGRIKKNIIVINECPNCLKELRIYGGNLED